jgi:hypothetical protein
MKMIKFSDYEVGQVFMSFSGYRRDLYILTGKDANYVYYTMLTYSGTTLSARLGVTSCEFWTIKPIEWTNEN